MYRRIKKGREQTGKLKYRLALAYKAGKMVMGLTVVVGDKALSHLLSLSLPFEHLRQ